MGKAKLLRLIQATMPLLPALLAAACASGSSETAELFTASRATPQQEWSNPAVPGYMGGTVPWEMADHGVVPVAVQPAAELVAGDGKLAMSISGVPFIVPQHAAADKSAAAVADGADCYASQNVQTSEIQGLTLDPTDGLAYACFELELPDEDRQTLGIAWYSLPSEMDGYFIGIGDRRRHTWHWYLGPDDAVLTFDAGWWHAAGDTGETLLVAVLLERGLPADFWQLRSGVTEVRGTGLVYEDSTRYVDPARPAAGVKRTSAMPAQLSLRSYAPPIGNQGAMGSCTAFGVADSAFNITLARLYADHQWDIGDDDLRASPMWCYVKSGIAPYGNWNPVCGAAVGRYMSQPFNLLTGTGSAVETTVPYYATEDCATSFPLQADEEAAVLRIDSWAALPKTNIVAAIKEQLAIYQRPVVIAMFGLEDGFLYYSGGVYHYGGSGGLNGGHAMCIVGYDDELQALDVRNSWGGYWGIDGYWWCGYDAAQDLADLDRFSAYYMTASYNAGAVEYFLDESPPPPQDYDEEEPNDTPATATALPAFDFADFSAQFAAGDAADYFSFEHAAGQHTTIKVAYSPAHLSPTVKLYDDQGDWLLDATGGGGTLTLSGVWSTAGTALVEVLNTAGDEGAYTLSGSASTPPPAPSGVVASDGSNVDGVTIGWSPVAEADSYVVQRATAADGAFADAGSTFDAEWTDFEVELWQEYWYRVLAVAGSGTSLPSSADSGYRAVPAPAGVTASDGEFGDHIEIGWRIDTPGTRYTVLRSVSPAGRYLTLGEFESAPVEDSSIVAGVIYYYIVCCSSEGRQGPLSEPDIGYVSIPGAGVDANYATGQDQGQLIESGGPLHNLDEQGVITVGK